MKTIELPAYQTEIFDYCAHVVNAFHPDCIILHGSLARGGFTPTSDIDLVVIGGKLPENFLKRLFALNQFRDGKTPLEVVGYTRPEWEQMMSNYHLTALEAIHWGIPLVGQDLFYTWQSRLDQWKSKGLRRDNQSWVIPHTL
jgi:predicted nucleotidyltransferase